MLRRFRKQGRSEGDVGDGSGGGGGPDSHEQDSVSEKLSPLSSSKKVDVENHKQLQLKHVLMLDGKKTVTGLGLGEDRITGANNITSSVTLPRQTQNRNHSLSDNRQTICDETETSPKEHQTIHSSSSASEINPCCAYTDLMVSSSTTTDSNKTVQQQKQQLPPVPPPLLFAQRLVNSACVANNNVCNSHINDLTDYSKYDCLSFLPIANSIEKRNIHAYDNIMKCQNRSAQNTIAQRRRPSHDHDYQPLPPQRRSVGNPSASVSAAARKTTSSKDNLSAKNVKQATLCSILRSHDHDYQPKPPQKRSCIGTVASKSKEGRTGQPGERRKVSQQQLMEVGDKLRVKIVTDDLNPCVREGDSDTIATTVQDKSETSSATKSPIRLPRSRAALNVTPSPPSKSKVKQQQQSQKSPIEVEVAENRSFRIGKLFKRYHGQRAKMVHEQLQHPKIQKNKPNGFQQQQQQQTSCRQDKKQIQSSVMQLAPTSDETSAQISPPGSKQIKSKEPPEETVLLDLRWQPQLTPQRPDPPPDPPAAYNSRGRSEPGTGHFEETTKTKSKTLEPHSSQSKPLHAKLHKKSEPPLKLRKNNPPQPKKISVPQHQVESKLSHKEQTEFKPVSQLKSKSMTKQQQEKAAKAMTPPLPLKKVKSTPSNFSSFFTESSRDSASNFWKEVEEYPEKAHILNNEDFNSHLAALAMKGRPGSNYKTSNNVLLKTKSSEAKYINKTLKNKHSLPQQSSRKSFLGSIHEDSDVFSNAFSLNLQGGFEDSISGLRMNDSATVYYQRQLNLAPKGDSGGEAAAAATLRVSQNDASEYWKNKYNRLKEETIKAAAAESAKNEKEKEQQQQLHQPAIVKKDKNQIELKNSENAAQMKTEEQVRGSCTKRNCDDNSQQTENDQGQGCLSTLNAIVEVMQDRKNCEGARRRDQLKNHCDLTLLSDGELIRSQNSISPPLHPFVLSQQPNMISPSPQHYVTPKKRNASCGTEETGLQDLQPISFVPLENDTIPKNIIRESEHIVPLSVSLADDLTAGASHLAASKGSLATDGDLSELSKHSKIVIESTSSYDMKALHVHTTVLSKFGKQQSLLLSTPRSKSMPAPNIGFIPTNFASWFELPSPGLSCCIPLLPLLDTPLRNSLTICDSKDVCPRYRTDDVVDLAFVDFVESVRFINTSVHLGRISESAVRAISRRKFQDAIEIYSTLLCSCETSKGPKLGTVGQLIVSTLHNLAVLHLWNQEYEKALPFCVESLRIKVELLGDEAGSVNLWSNLALIRYALGSFAPALAAFRKAVELSSLLEERGKGILLNNIGCINFDVGKLSLVQSQLKQSLQLQKALETNAPTSAEGRGFFSISITMFNVGVVAASSGWSDLALSHIQACLAIQQALFGDNNRVVQSTTYYLESLRSRIPALVERKKASNVKQHEVNHRVSQDMTEPQQFQGVEPIHIQFQEELDLQPKEFINQKSQSSSQGQQKIGYVAGGANDTPLLSLGNLRAEDTTAQRVHKTLESCADSFAKQGFDKSHHLNMLTCKRLHPSINLRNQRTLSQNILNYGLQTMKKREAMSELRRKLQRYGPAHPQVGECHHSLGLFYLFTQNYLEAIKHLASSVKIFMDALGVKHPDVASTLMLKGFAYLALDKLDESMACMLRVLRMREDILGHNHPEIGKILNNIACVQYDLGDCKKAESLFQEALDLQREVFTTEPAFLKAVSIVLCNIAFLHARRGDYPKALIEFEGALQIRQDILLENDSLSDITENMAHILAIHQLQHGVLNLDEITEEYITMLRKSGTKDIKC